MFSATLCKSSVGRLVLAFAGWFVIAAFPAMAAPNEGAASPPARYALVIGNGDYAHKPLANPRNDAELMAQTLGQMGFSVTTAHDIGRQELFSAVREFSEKLPDGAVAMVYYAGHGMQIGGANYLIPVDMAPTSEQGIALRGFPLAALLDRLAQARSAVNIVVLDACRNNPFQSQGAARYRDFSRLGLARVSTPRGSLVAYSTAPGQLAEDGAGRKHSLYTETLAAELLRPGRTVEEVFKQVADIVRKKSFDDQQPWFETSLVDDFYFRPPPGVQMVTRPPALRVADARSARAGRGVQAAGKRQESDWYLGLDESEWSNFDWEVAQRVKRLTEDEIPLLEHRARSGNVVAQTTLGIVYREGIRKIVESGTGRTFRSGASNTKAIQWLRKAAEAGFPMAQVELGEMYYQGHGVERDAQESIRWLELASRASYPRARLDLAQVKAFAAPSPAAFQDMIQEVMRNTNEVMQQQQSRQR